MYSLNHEIRNKLIGDLWFLTFWGYGALGESEERVWTLSSEKNKYIFVYAQNSSDKLRRKERENM